MMMDWIGYRADVSKRIGELASMSPDVLEGMRKMAGSSAKTALLGPKVHELIALAVAVTTRCDGCIISHTKAAVEYGATREEIAEALGTAIALNAGAAAVYSARVLDAHAALPDVQK